MKFLSVYVRSPMIDDSHLFEHPDNDVVMGGSWRELNYIHEHEML